MGLDAIAGALADAAFTPGTKRTVVAWESAPNRISVTGKLRGVGKKGIVVVVRNGNTVALSVRGPSNATCDTTRSMDDLTSDAVMRFARTALDELMSRQQPWKLPFRKLKE